VPASDRGFGEQEVVDADGRMDVFGRAWDQAARPPISIFHRTSDNSGPTAAVGVSWFPLLRQTPPSDDWQLVVRRRRGGPLGAFVADMQRRGLALSFGALCLLVLSLSMLVITSIRAQRLARLQMDFVTAVSHELRTPLTIIGSAADNIANGVVDSKPQLQEYGSVIGEQASRLSGLVERVLLFAATRDGQQRYVTQSLLPSEIIDAALASTEGLIRAAQFTIEGSVCTSAHCRGGFEHAGNTRCPCVCGIPAGRTGCGRTAPTSVIPPHAPVDVILEHLGQRNRPAALVGSVRLRLARCVGRLGENVGHSRECGRGVHASRRRRGDRRCLPPVRGGPGNGSRRPGQR
jgi:hypothetical protein